MKKSFLLFAVAFILLQDSYAQFFKKETGLAHTFSIVAREIW